MTTMDKRIIKKNLAYSVKFNGFLIRSNESNMVPKGACVIFKDSKDSRFSASNARLAKDILKTGGNCVVAESKNGSWLVYPASI